MTKGELIKVLESFKDEVEIFRPVADNFGDEFETSIERIEYTFEQDNEAKILLR